MYCKKEASNGFFFQRTNQLLSPYMDMLHSRCHNTKKKFLHERCLRLAYCNKELFYEYFYEKVPLSICHRNLHSLAIGLYKA